MHRAHHVRGERLHGLAVGKAHEGLCSEVEYEVRLCGHKGACERLPVAYVADLVGAEAPGKAELVEKRWVRRRLEGETSDVSAERKEPFAEPRALKARVARHEHPCAAVAAEVRLHFQLLVHGAAPLLHNLFRSSYSRAVSMHCQNPSWR